jgi:hypothetical protein
MTSSRLAVVLRPVFHMPTLLGSTSIVRCFDEDIVKLFNIEIFDVCGNAAFAELTILRWTMREAAVLVFDPVEHGAVLC